MVTRLDVNPLLPFDPVGDPTSLSQCWKLWKRRFETYLIALNITDDKQKRALLLTTVCGCGLTISFEKCELNIVSLTFFGLVFSAKGVSPDPKTIHNAPPPTSVSEVRSFLSMVTYCAKSIPNFSDITKPLRELTKKCTVSVERRTLTSVSKY